MKFTFVKECSSQNCMMKIFYSANKEVLSYNRRYLQRYAFVEFQFIQNLLQTVMLKNSPLLFLIIHFRFGWYSYYSINNSIMQCIIIQNSCSSTTYNIYQKLHRKTFGEKLLCSDFILTAWDWQKEKRRNENNPLKNNVNNVKYAG